MAASRKRRGMSLLELIIASSMLAMLMTSISVVLRGPRIVDAHEADYTRIEAAHSVLRHVVREVRTAEAVTEVSDPTDDSGRLGLRMQNGDIHIWDHDGTNNRVDFGVATPDNLLATEITGLRFRGFEADGVTAVATAADVQCLQIEVTIQLPRDVNGQRIVTSWAWVRAW